MADRYCVRCGHAAGAEDRFCAACGAQLEEVVKEETVAVTAGAEVPPQYVQTPPATPATPQPQTPPAYTPPTMYCRQCGQPLCAGASVCTCCGVRAGMGAGFCAHCGQSVHPQAQVCVHCGRPVAVTGGKSRVCAGLLAIFLGTLGAHNFYLGYTGKAVAQLLITVLFWWLFIPLIGIATWSIIEGILLLSGSTVVDGRGQLLSE